MIVKKREYIDVKHEVKENGLNYVDDDDETIELDTNRKNIIIENKVESENINNCNKIDTFEDLGLHKDLLKVLELKGWKHPTPIQKESIPLAIKGKDILGLAVTGSGKTGAFLIPIIDKMLKTNIHARYAVIISPTRELSIQIADQARSLGSASQIKVSTLVGGLSQVDQAKELAKDPHIIVGSPGRLLDHLQNTKGFDLLNIKFLVMDEADRLLSMDFEETLHEILKVVNQDRQTFLFSATLTSKISKLEKLSLKSPQRIQVNEKNQTAINLKQYIVLVKADKKFEILVALIKPLNAYRIIVFCNTCKLVTVLDVFLRKLGYDSIALSGEMNQNMRLNHLNRFKHSKVNILIATEVAARGMDLPDVQYVINFDVPTTHKEYIHRVGRTARAGKNGSSFTLITKLDVVLYKMIENRIFGDNENLWPSVYNEVYDIHKLICKSINFEEAKNEAEKEYLEIKSKKYIKKRKLAK